MRTACAPICAGLALVLVCLLAQSCMVRDRPEGFVHFDEVNGPGAPTNVGNSPITLPKETPKETDKEQHGEAKKPSNEQPLPAVDPPKKTSYVGSAPLAVTCKMPTKTPSYLGSTKTFRVGVSATMKVLPPSERVAAMAVVKPWRSGHPTAIHGQRILALDRLNGNCVVANRGETAYTLDEHSLSITALDLSLVTDPGDGSVPARRQRQDAQASPAADERPDAQDGEPEHSSTRRAGRLPQDAIVVAHLDPA